jgi:hypothetical protein
MGQQAVTGGRGLGLGRKESGSAAVGRRCGTIWEGCVYTMHVYVECAGQTAEELEAFIFFREAAASSRSGDGNGRERFLLDAAAEGSD